MEPAAHGKPVLVGPYMFNFREIFDLLSKRGVCRMAQNESELEKTLRDLLAHPEKNEGYGGKRRCLWWQRIRGRRKGM